MDIMVSEWIVSIWALIFFSLPIIALIMLLSVKGKADLNLLFWLLVILFVPIIGSILYFLIGHRQIKSRTRSKGRSSSRDNSLYQI